jgi:hypothetical protein
MTNSVVMSLIKRMAGIRWRSGACITRKVENTQTCMTSILIRPLPGRIVSHVPLEPIVASSSIIQHMPIKFFRPPSCDYQLTGLLSLTHTWTCITHVLFQKDHKNSWLITFINVPKV